ncbi:MAG: hypothetical protein JWM98_795 [Thermoleophilia bacterium]|nr:hypothetical protein [Thermoleophilia bacterium]
MPPMGRRLLGWWEALPDRRRVLYGIPVALVVLFAFHQAFFPLLDWQRSLTYAVMECVPVALAFAWATQNELRRRADRDARADDPPVDG